MQTVISPELKAAEMHHLITKRAWWCLLILPTIGLDIAIAINFQVPPISIGSIAYSSLFYGILIKINELSDEYDSGYFNSHKFSDETNACFDANSMLDTATTPF